MRYDFHLNIHHRLVTHFKALKSIDFRAFYFFTACPAETGPDKIRRKAEDMPETYARTSSNSSTEAETYMRKAIQLAKDAGNHMHPNPLVGAVIVKDSRIIGSGAHETYGSLHAERNALKSCTEDPAGADIYVTLEPCCHQGKQPPCTQALIDAGISRCFIGSPDPNPLVSGKGIKILEDAGITVFTEVLREECDALNPVFFHFMETHRPLVTLKYAMSLDGKIACYTGKSQWITGEEARANVSVSRAAHMAVLTSVATVTCDDPLLTAHGKAAPDPIRIVCDSKLTTPLDAKILRDLPVRPGDQPNQNSNQDQNSDPKAAASAKSAAPASGGADALPKVSFDGNSRYPRTIIATCETAREKQLPYLEKGAVILTVPEDESGRVDLNVLLDKLGEMGIDSLYTECGAGLLGSLLDNRLADRAEVYVAPKILGNPSAKSPVGGIGCGDPNLAGKLCPMETRRIGDDLLITGSFCYPGEEA